MSGENPITVCPNCNEPLEPDFEVCPNCGKERSLSCPNCQRPIKSKWKVCPRCRTSLSGWATPTHGASSANRIAGNSIDSPFVSGAQSNNEVPLVEGDELLGRFIIKAKLGAGGFGTVYHAHDHERRSDIALKVVVADSGQSQTATEQLRQELRLRDRINDFTHIVRTYDIHTVDYKGLSFVLLPMEYAETGSLRSWLIEHKHNKKHRISEGLELFKQTCLGIKAIHDAGLAHLDLKPENLLLCKDGDKIIVKVSDFGISRNVEHFSINVASVMQESLGTPYYMSPEQIRTARQKDVGSQADIYSLGIILFEILDGDPPFDGSAEEVKHKHLEMEPPKLKGIDKTIATLVDKCLTKKPAERFQTVASVLNVLGVSVSSTEELDENAVKIREAVALHNGTNGKIDYTKAKALFLELAERDYPLGKMWVAQCYNTGCCNFPNDVERAQKIANEVIDQVKQSALLGDEMAAFLLGNAYQSGLGLDQDYKKAIEWYRKSAETGNNDAMYDLGWMYESGYGVTQDDEKAAECFRKSAEAGNTNGLYTLAMMYEVGLGVTKDCEKTVELYRKAANIGDRESMCRLGILYKEGRCVTQNDEKAAEWYLKSAEAGNMVAMTKLARMYQEGGRDVAKDYSKAKYWFHKASEMGDSLAMLLLGLMYKKGEGVTQDHKQAFRFLSNAAEEGESDAMLNLGVMYQNGLGVTKDYKKAIEYYHKAAEAENGKAMVNLGRMYQEGLGIAIDYEKAMEWYHKAAEAGYGVAMFNLGLMFENGQGVPEDYEKAKEWYKKATEAGNSYTTVCNLGMMHYGGIGVAKDYTKAMEWFREAAEAGNGVAMYYLGEMYRNGDGVSKDYQKAIEWYREAAQLGDKNAQQKLAELEETW